MTNDFDKCVDIINGHKKEYIASGTKEKKEQLLEIISAEVNEVISDFDLSEEQIAELRTIG